MEGSISLYIAIFMLAGLAILGNSFCVLYFWLYIKSFSSLTTQLLLTLHVCSIFESISSLPYIFIGSSGCCKAMGAFHYFFGLIIMGVDVCLSVSLYNNLHKNDQKLERRMQKYAVPSIITFSIITFLPLTTNSYGVNNRVWCSINYYHESDNAWSFGIFYVWALIAWLVSFAFIVNLSYTAMGTELKTRVFRSVASYLVATLFSIGPRLFPRLINLFVVVDISFDEQFLVQGGIYASVVMYSFCFYLSRKTLIAYERSSVLDWQTRGTLSPSFFDFSLSLTSRTGSSASSPSLLLEGIRSLSEKKSAELDISNPMHELPLP